MHSKAFKLTEHFDLAQGLAALHFDLPGEKVNKLGPAVMTELDEVLDTLKHRSDIKALLFLSEKEGIFIAGADIQVIQGIKTSQEGTDLASQGQAVIEKIERLPFPVIAAINGASMGGGTELALCCKYIIVSDNPATRIGLPEVNLGVLPGFGGTVRMPARIGLQAAMDHILTGKNMNGDKAYKLGFAEAVFPYQTFKQHALAFGAKVARGEIDTRKRKMNLMSFALEGTPMGRAVMFSQAKKMVLKKTRGHYPAAIKIIDVLSENYGKNKRDALNAEAKAFGELAVTDVSKRLIDLFYATENIKKQTGVEGQKIESKDKVQTTALLGAGVMGGGIAQLLAHKSLPVRMKDIDYKGLALGTGAATKIFGDLVKKRRMTKREAEIKFALISPTTDYTGFNKVDLVIEAVVENMDVKKKVLKETEAELKDGAIFATNTSSLSVTELATASRHPENVVGMHFFNPVHKMPLVEVVRADKTSDRAVLAIFELSKRLGKTPIVVKDGPGFLVNRLLMPYLNEASYLLAEGAPIEELDEAALNFGMPMGPANLLDEIGIDVAVKVAKILHHAFGVRAQPCVLNEKLVEAKLMGKKASKGFYIYNEQGKKDELNPEIYKVIGITPRTPTKVQKAHWMPRMVYPMINEAALCLSEGIVSNAQDVDIGMIMGTGFPPFRGGLLRYADSVGVAEIAQTLKEFSQTIGPRFEPTAPLLEMARRNAKFYS